MLDHEKPAIAQTPTVHVSTRVDTAMTPRDWLVAAAMGFLIASAVGATVVVGQLSPSEAPPSWSALESH